MGLKNTLDAANRYGENTSILDKVANREIKHGTPEDEKQFDYFVRSNDSQGDIETIMGAAVKSLKANGQKVTAENLDKFFKSLIQVYMPQDKGLDVMDSPETNELLGELTPTNTENLYTDEDGHFGEEQSNDYPDPGDVGGLIYNSTAKRRNALMRDWLEHNFNNDGFGLPKALFNRINDSVTKLTGPNKDPEDETAFIDALNKEFKNDFVSDEDDHFGEEQAEGLSNLLEGLRDTPHDNRW